MQKTAWHKWKEETFHSDFSLRYLEVRGQGTTLKIAMLAKF